MEGLGGAKERSYIHGIIIKRNKSYMRINVNATNSKVIGGKLFITGLKMSQLKSKLAESIIQGSTVAHPTMGLLYEYDGPFSRA